MDVPANNDALSSEDVDRMVLAYLRTPSTAAPKHPGNFVHEIMYRVYTEWCMNNSGIDHQSNFATGLREFINKETHYELVRMKKFGNGESGKFEGLTHEEYRNVRNQVLDAIVKRALEENLPKRYSERDHNLRGDLRSYL
ncbi:hypothetical protein HYW20_08755 [Candidatus Woesearchaeota archaeon]|nr:hypothetical protein [Candidatus Woesearchaeota archaeon]